MKGNMDCFAYDKGGACNALKSLVCARKNCKFYKTKEEMEQERKHTKIRLAHMLASGEVKWNNTMTHFSSTSHEEV
ncbi:MAG TPA: hypothetical protein DCW90_09370, partial [Lachnospiraceae bacterium]|nr:hypothetical protein [Lachnospiraceae bacterium]